MTEQRTQSAALDAAKTGAQIHAQMFSSALSRISSHASDCPVHNEPAMPAGPCDCATRVPGALESKAYADGTTATGPGPLPDLSPAEQSIEAEIQAKGLTAPRVMPDDIQQEIVGEHYFTAEQGARHPDAQNPLDFGDIPGNLGLLTFCVLRLRNGFTVTGESACASPENFDAAIGRRIARENAVQKVWPLLGFRLRDKLASGV